MNQIINVGEDFYESVGLRTPIKRAGFTFASVLGIQYLVKPSFSFREDGTPRPNIFISNEPDATFFCPFNTALLGAVVSGNLI